jgi:glycerophosphoryl diester phosphodiesterase
VYGRVRAGFNRAVALHNRAMVAAQVLTYGRQNNDPAFVRQQAPLGVQAVIVDDVARIAALYPSERARSDA